MLALFRYALEGGQHAAVNELRTHRLVAQPDEGHVERHAFRQTFQQYVFLQTVRFSHLAFGPIAVNGMLELPL